MLYCEQLTWVGGDRACGGGWGWTVGCPSRDLCLAAGQLMICQFEADLQLLIGRGLVLRPVTGAGVTVDSKTKH